MSADKKSQPKKFMRSTYVHSYSFSVEDLAKAQLYTDTNLGDVDFPVTISNRVLNSQWRAMSAPQRRLYIRDAERIIRILATRGKR